MQKIDLWKYWRNRVELIVRRMDGIAQLERTRVFTQQETWSAASWKLSRGRRKRLWIESIAAFLAIFVFSRFCGICCSRFSHSERPRISTPRISAIVANTNTFFPSKHSLPSNPLLPSPFERIFIAIGVNSSRTKPICKNAENTPRIRSKTLSRIVPITDNVSSRFNSRSSCFSTRLLSPHTQKTHRIAALEGVWRKTSGQPISLWRCRDCERACRCSWEPTISTITRWASPVPILLPRDIFWGFRWAIPSAFMMDCIFACAWRDRASCCIRFERWLESRSKWREVAALSTRWIVAWVEAPCSLPWLQARDCFYRWYSIALPLPCSLSLQSTTRNRTTQLEWSISRVKMSNGFDASLRKHKFTSTSTSKSKPSMYFPLGLHRMTVWIKNML